MTLRAAAVAAAPFFVVAAVFAGFVAHHLQEPAAPAERLPWLVAHDDVPLPRATGEDWVELERAACGAGCPSYAVRVWGSGRVEFEGRAHVCRPGRAEGALPRGHGQRLVAALRETAPPAGAVLPTPVALTLHAGGADRVLPREGAAQPWFTAALAAVDQAIADTRWLPAPGAAGADCRTPLVPR